MWRREFMRSPGPSWEVLRWRKSPTPGRAAPGGSPADRRWGNPPPGCGRPHRCYDEPMPAPYTSELARSLADDLLERFVRYARVDTQSARERSGSPSTPGQLDLARMLVEELQAIGLSDAELDANGYVFATLPATVE